MINEKRWSTTPNEHILDLFSETKDGKLKITYYPELEDAFSVTYNIDWSLDDAKKLTAQFQELCKSLYKIAKHYPELADEEARARLLNGDEQATWETYIRPYEAFEVDLSVIGELFIKAEYNELDDDENALLERHNNWLERESRKRLPVIVRSSKYVINRAQRYVRLIHLGAEEIVYQEEARCLAEEMVLYYYSR